MQKNKIAYGIATCMGVGYARIGPGTFGSLVAIPIIYFSGRSDVVFISTYLILLLAGIWSSRVVAESEGKEDPQHVVIDEVAGMMTSFLFVALRWQTILLGFLLFRLFDIWKPFPIRKLEPIRGGVGIVFDDVMAGVYVNVILHVLIRYAHL